jgi:hypothetical protein
MPSKQLLRWASQPAYIAPIVRGGNDAIPLTSGCAVRQITQDHIYATVWDGFHDLQAVAGVKMDTHEETFLINRGEGLLRWGTKKRSPGSLFS